jgi:hypothetical protein
VAYYGAKALVMAAMRWRAAFGSILGSPRALLAPRAPYRRRPRRRTAAVTPRSSSCRSP